MRGDLNGWDGDRMRANIIGIFEIPEKIVMEEEVFIYVLKRSCICVMHTLNT